MIKSIGSNQYEIINNILALHNGGRSIDFDPCYNIGGFYKNGVVTGPRVRSDINPLCPGVLKLDVRDLPFGNSAFKSIIFDPPFLVSGDREQNKSKMCQKYGSFDSLEELETFYLRSLVSLQRVLKHGGLLIFKCQDFVHGRKQHLVLPYICNKARELNFSCRDLFICIANNRIENKISKQQHARKYHCYFLVLKNNKRIRSIKTRENLILWPEAKPSGEATSQA